MTRGRPLAVGARGGEKNNRKSQLWTFHTLLFLLFTKNLRNSFSLNLPRASPFRTMAFALKSRVCMGANTRAGRRSVSLRRLLGEGFF